jgi:ABC-type polysaccharide/polyol phosphate export permease
MIFCAMFFPFKALPDFIVKYVCMFIPFSYSVDAFRTVLVNVEPELLPLSQEIVIITACGVGMMILGILYFKYMERKVRIAGTLGEY